VSTPISFWLPARSLWWRELVRFYRQKARVVGVIASPFVFWLVIGAGFGRSVQSGGGQQNFLLYFFPGALIMIVLFTSIFTMMSVIEDRNEGFLMSVLVAPVKRSSIVMGKVLGGASLATIQGLIFLVFAPFVGIKFGAEQFVWIVVIVFLVSFALTALGFAVAWKLNSTQAFHGIINLFLIPLWMLSGAMFPVEGASGWIRIIMQVNPLTYGVEALRLTLFPEAATPSSLALSSSLGILIIFSAVVFAVALSIASRRSERPAA
jgi:ABC-2 type transport system permease protein